MSNTNVHKEEVGGKTVLLRDSPSTSESRSRSDSVLSSGSGNSNTISNSFGGHKGSLIEKARFARNKCGYCHADIDEGELCVGKHLEAAPGIVQWFHYRCYLKNQNQEGVLDVVCAEDLVGFALLPEDEHKRVVKLFNKFLDEFERNHNANKLNEFQGPSEPRTPPHTPRRKRLPHTPLTPKRFSSPAKPRTSMDHHMEQSFLQEHGQHHNDTNDEHVPEGDDRNEHNLYRSLFKADASSVVLPSSTSLKTNPLLDESSSREHSVIGSSSFSEVDVIVIGGGVSGLTAAYELKQKGYSVLVLEAKSRIGGRVHTGKIKGHECNVPCDFGGQWVSSAQPQVLGLINKFGIEIYHQFSDGKNIIQLKDSPPRSYTGNIPLCLDIPTTISLGILSAICEFLISKISFDFLFEGGRSMFDFLTLSEVCRRLSVRSGTLETIKMMTRVCFGSEPEEMSFLYFLYYCKCTGSLDQLLDAHEGGGQEFKVVGGCGVLPHRLADYIGHENVLVSHPVTQITHSERGGVQVVANDEIFSAKRCVLAIPPQLIPAISFEPPLPSWRQQAYTRMPMGHLIKILVTYTTPFWRQNGFSGSAISSDGVLCTVMDCTFPADIAYGLVMFIGGEDAFTWSTRSEKRRKHGVLSALQAMFGEQVWNYIEYKEKDWAQEPFNGGCPVAIMPPGLLNRCGHSLQKGWSCFHFAGTETAHKWRGFINGAVEAGQRVCKEIENILPPSGRKSMDNTIDTHQEEENPLNHVKIVSTRGSMDQENITSDEKQEGDEPDSKLDLKGGVRETPGPITTIVKFVAYGFLLHMISNIDKSPINDMASILFN